MYPYGSPGLFSRGFSLARGVNWGSLLDGTQKTLGVINQAIPIVYQVRPLIKNAKTMFRIASQMAASDDHSNSVNNAININANANNQMNNMTNNTSISANNRPVFYI